MRLLPQPTTRMRSSGLHSRSTRCRNVSYLRRCSVTRSKTKTASRRAPSEPLVLLFLCKACVPVLALQIARVVRRQRGRRSSGVGHACAAAAGCWQRSTKHPRRVEEALRSTSGTAPCATQHRRHRSTPPALLERRLVPRCDVAQSWTPLTGKALSLPENRGVRKRAGRLFGDAPPSAATHGGLGLWRRQRGRWPLLRRWSETSCLLAAAPRATRSQWPRRNASWRL